MKKIVLPTAVLVLSLTLVGQLFSHTIPTMLVSMSRVPQPESFEKFVNESADIVLADVVSVKQGPDFVAPIEGTNDFHRVPSQRILVQVVKGYKGKVIQGQTLTLYQDSTGMTEARPHANGPLESVFMKREDDPLYNVGERYLLMLTPVPMPDAIKKFQPEPWQEGMVMPSNLEGRLVIGHNNMVKLAADLGDSKVGKLLDGQPLERIEGMLAAITASNTSSK
jgi:hypothetical protein